MRVNFLYFSYVYFELDRNNLFTINDLLNTQRWQQTALNETLKLTTYRKWVSRNLSIGFTWRMGNTKIKNARERQTVGDEDAGHIK